jgi:hypothetical protein
MYTNNKPPPKYGTYTKIFWSSWESITFWNIPQDTWPIDLYMSYNVFFRTPVTFQFLHTMMSSYHDGRGSEALYLVSLLSLLFPDVTSFLGCAYLLLAFQQDLIDT